MCSKVCVRTMCNMSSRHHFEQKMMQGADYAALVMLNKQNYQIMV